MARNEEKQLGRLNRLHLKELRDEEERKNPKRPNLASLNTAAEVIHWLPSIKKDLDFYLKQSEVPCYPERVISEFTDRIGRLKGEYRAFVAKLRQLDPEYKLVPESERTYVTQARKRKSKNDKVDTKEGETTIEKSVKIKKLELPLLVNDNSYASLHGVSKSKDGWNQVVEYGTENDDFEVNEESEAHSVYNTNGSRTESKDQPHISIQSSSDITPVATQVTEGPAYLCEPDFFAKRNDAPLIFEKCRAQTTAIKNHAAPNEVCMLIRDKSSRHHSDISATSHGGLEAGGERALVKRREGADFVTENSVDCAPSNILENTALQATPRRDYEFMDAIAMITRTHWESA